MIRWELKRGLKFYNIEFLKLTFNNAYKDKRERGLLSPLFY